MSRIRSYDLGDEPVPGYRITGFLGSGGFGEVWQATAPGGTEVAIKILNLGMTGALKEFRSLRLVKRIRYPNLVPILAIWLKDAKGQLLDEAAFEDVPTSLAGKLTDTIDFKPRIEPAELIIAMGLGTKSLADRLEECRQQGLTGIPQAELLNYMQDAARAIDFLNSAHRELQTDSKAIQHCDIKPPNILIVGDAAQVCDFGLARQVDDLRKTSLGLSPVYAAPEMIESNAPSSSTDQYSLAVSYLELRTGELPFPPEATAHSVIQAHLKGDLDLSRLPPAERTVIRRGTARKPADRFATTSDMVAALREAVQPVRTVSRRPGWLWWAAACAVAAGALAGGLMLVPHGTSSLTRLELPATLEADPATAWRTVGNRSCPDRIMYQGHGLKIPFLLVDSARADPLRAKNESSFYIMENKVSNEQFGRFAEQNPELVAESNWAQGACQAGDQTFVASEHPQFPVFNITCNEAYRFAHWIGGDLPTIDQWDLAAGRYAENHRPGPFQELDSGEIQSQVAVDRGLAGPLPVGSATRDIAVPFGCRDMAGNGYEWTSTAYGSERFSPDKETQAITLRGNSYMAPEPLSYDSLAPDSDLGPGTAYSDQAKCLRGFRVTITIPDLRN